MSQVGIKPCSSAKDMQTFTDCATPSAVILAAITLFIHISRVLIRRKKDALSNGDSNPGHGDKTRATPMRHDLICDAGG